MSITKATGAQMDEILSAMEDIAVATDHISSDILVNAMAQFLAKMLANESAEGEREGNLDKVLTGMRIIFDNEVKR